MGTEDASHGKHRCDHSANLGNSFDKMIGSLLVLGHCEVL